MRALSIFSALTTVLCSPSLVMGVTTSSGSDRVESTTLFIKEFRVEGAHKLNRTEIEETVYPFLGPGRTVNDVEEARAALEKAYKDKGYQTVSVQIPAQRAGAGIVILQVSEAPVGRLRVKGSRFYSPRQIKAQAPSLAEGTVPNFNEVTRDIVGLNQLPDRQVTPTLRAGVEPGTFDIDLNVADKLPLHGAVELNNRYSPDTTELRLNGSISYNNLWGLGHSIGFSFQLAPERIDDAKVFSAYYLARVPDAPWLSLLAQGTKQDSNVSTLGGAGVVGRGEIVGMQAIVTLPPGKNFYHSLTFGFNYKHYTQDLTIAGTEIPTPITYYPFNVDYNATWVNPEAVTALDAGITFGARGLGSDEAEFDFNRFKASGNFFNFRGSLSRTRELPAGLQVFGKLQGQVASGPLLSSEQFNAGGWGTVRGYLESEVLGDDAVIGSVELRSPSLFLGSNVKNEWRFYLFSEGGMVTLQDALPDQESQFYLASIGAGSRIQLRNHFNGSLDLGVPLVSQAQSKALDLLLTFRMWADF